VSRRCRFARSVLPYVDGELAAHDAVAFEDHLEQCASCGAAVAAQRRLEERLIALPRPVTGVDDRIRLHERIHRRIGERFGAGLVASAIEPRRPRLLGSPPLLAAAGIVLLAALAFLPQLRRPAAERPSAATPAGATPGAVAVAPLDFTPISFERPEVSLALLASARDQIARCVASLPAEGDPVDAFEAATRTLRAKGVPVVHLLEQEILRDPDPELGCKAAELLAAAARTGRLGSEGSLLVPTLEAVMRRPDRGEAILKTLLAIGTPRAWGAVALACEMPHLRHGALVAIASRKDAVGLPKLQTELVASLRRGERDDVAAALGALDANSDAHVHLLAELARAGVEPRLLTEALERSRPAASAALAAMLPQRGEPRRDAFLLAPLLRDARLVAPLADLVARGDDAAAAADALVRVGGSEAAVALARLAADPSLSRSRGRTVANAFASLLARSEGVAALLGAAVVELQDDERPRAALLDLCLAAPDAAGARARLALLACSDLAAADRTRLAAELTTRRERAAPEELLTILSDAAAHRAEGKSDDRLLAALLLLVYANGGDDRLMEGVRALGVALTPARERQLKTTARALVRSPSVPQKLGRLDSLLELAP
jgi:putative zinc finger protein